MMDAGLTCINTPRAFLTSLFDAAVAQADPMRVIAQHLPPRPKGRLIVIGAGKASARMAEAAEAHCGPCEGLAITRYGYARPCEGIEIVEAAHPVPDAAGEAATRRLLDMVSEATIGPITTRSPTARPVTPSPSSEMVPQYSWPMVMGAWSRLRG